MGTNGVTGSTSGIYSELIEGTIQEIDEKNRAKAIAKAECSAADDNIFVKWQNKNNAEKQKAEVDNCKKKIEKQIAQKKIEISQAKLKGNTADIAKLQQELSNLEGMLTLNSGNGKSITELFEEAGKEYQNARFAGIASDNWFLSILSDLFSLYLDKGKYEQAQTVYNHMNKLDVNG